jgi:hypothetical protein
MHILRSVLGLIGRAALGLSVGLGAVSPPLLGGLGLPTAADAPAAIASAARTTTSQRSPEWAFQFDEPTLTQDLNAWLAGQPLVQTPVGAASLQDLTVGLRDDQVVVRGTAKAGWLGAQVDLSASAYAETGRVLVHVRNAHVSGVDLPEPVQRQIEQQLQDQVDYSLTSYRVVVSSVHVGDGKLDIAGSLQ